MAGCSRRAAAGSTPGAAAACPASPQQARLGTARPGAHPLLSAPGARPRGGRRSDPTPRRAGGARQPPAELPRPRGPPSGPLPRPRLGLRRPKGATRASFAVPGRFLVSALQAAFPKKSRVAQRRGRQENVGSAARVRRLAAPLLRVLRQTFTEAWFLARSARQGTSHFWHGEK